MRIDTDDVEQIGDSLQRSLAADEMMAEAERIIVYLKELRAEAMRAHARKVGGFQAANDLKMNRASMYRAIRKGVSSAKVERDDMYWNLQAKALDARLRKQGKTQEGIRVWWYSTRHPQLGQRTAAEAWNAGDKEAVIALVP
jgi:hypothetical protein